MGFVLGFIIAWQLHKFFLYVSAGFIGFFVFGLFSALSGNLNSFVLTGILGAVISVYLVYKFHDIIIIILMALPFSVLVFYLSIPEISFGYLSDSLFKRNNIDYLEAIILIFKAYHTRFIIVVTLFTCFSVYYQLFSKISEKDSIFTVQFKVVFRRLSKWFALLSIVYFFWKIFFYYRIEDVFIFTISLWPLLAYIISIILCFWYKIKQNTLLALSKNYLHWPFYIVVSILIIPLLIKFLSFPYYIEIPTSNYHTDIHFATLAEGIKTWLLHILVYFTSTFSFSDRVYEVGESEYFGYAIESFWVYLDHKMKIFQAIYYFGILPFILNNSYKKINNQTHMTD